MALQSQRAHRCRQTSCVLLANYGFSFSPCELYATVTVKRETSDFALQPPNLPSSEFLESKAGIADSTVTVACSKRKRTDDAQRVYDERMARKPAVIECKVCERRYNQWGYLQ